MEADLVGQRMNLMCSRQEATWSLPDIAPPVGLQLDTRLIVDLDINQRMRAAKKALKKFQTRTCMPMKNV